LVSKFALSAMVLLVVVTAFLTAGSKPATAAPSFSPQTLIGILEEAKLTVCDGSANDEFGYSVSVSGDTAIVGTIFGDTIGGVDSGSAYVYVRSGGVWIQEAKLTASDGSANDEFGWSVSVSGDTAIVGARIDDTIAGGDSGSAYVYVRSGGVWTEETRLTASDASSGDQLGYSVSVSGDTAIVGAILGDSNSAIISGSAYVYVRSGGIWTEEAKLTASDSAIDDNFGWSVSVSGNTAIVGAVRGDSIAGVNSGSAFVYVRSGGIWTEEAKLTASDGAIGDAFGFSVSVSGDTVIVGARDDDSIAGLVSGSAFVYVRSGGIWTEEAKLTASDGAIGDRFGISVSVSGDTAIVGAIFHDTIAGGDSGSAYVYVIAQSTVPGVPITGAIMLQGVSSSTAFAIIGPTVTLIPVGGGTSTTVAVASDGSFSIASVQDGTYTITASAVGFLSAQRQNLIVAGSSIVMPGIELRGGEVTGDGVVSILDISAIAASFGTFPPNRVDGFGRPVDLNADGVVDILNSSIAASNFGTAEPLSW